MSVTNAPVSRDALPPIDPMAAITVSRKTGMNNNQWLQHEIASRMAQRLSFIRQHPQRWMDWEPLSGGLSALGQVQAIYPRAQVIQLQPDATDLIKVMQARKPPWWQFWKKQDLQYDTSPLHAVDMVWSNLRLHQHADPLSLMKAWCEALNPQGFVMFSCLGPDSLQELREVYKQHQWPEPHHAFTDMHDWGDMLLQAGFTQPVMDMERLTLTYQSAADLLRDLRAWGRNLHPQRFPGTRTKCWRQDLLNALESARNSEQHPGKLTMSFEIIYGHAFKAAPTHAVKPLTRVELSDMKQMLRSGQSAGNHT